MSLIANIVAALKPPQTPPNTVDPFDGKPLTEILAHGREINITPTLALRILRECAYKHQRDIKEPKIAAYTAAIKSGRFWPGRQMSWAICNGRPTLANGHHRLLACIRANKPIVVMAEIVQVDSERIIHDLYGTYDTGGRTMKDISGELVTTRLNKTQISALMSACVLLNTGFRKPDPIRDASVLLDGVVRRNIARGWTGTAEAYFDIINSAPSRTKVMLYRQPVVAVALRILRDQPETGTEFWQGLAEDDGLARTDPRKGEFPVAMRESQ
jgi:hypothetical protein